MVHTLPLEENFLYSLGNKDIFTSLYPPMGFALVEGLASYHYLYALVIFRQDLIILIMTDHKPAVIH